MTSLTILEYGENRVTDDGRYSVYDTIFVLAGKKNPRDAWKNVCEQYPVINLVLESAWLQPKEVVVKTDKRTGEESTKNVWHLSEARKEYGVVIKDKAFDHDKTVESVRWLPNVLKLIELS